MMLCKPDGSNKHKRWFQLDFERRTVTWTKKPGADGGKGPFVVTGVDEKGGGVLVIRTDGEDVTVRPADSVAYQSWLSGAILAQADF